MINIYESNKFYNDFVLFHATLENTEYGYRNNTIWIL